MTNLGVVQHDTVSIHALIPHQDNYNKHPQSQLEKLKDSVRKFNQVRDVIVKVIDDKYQIIAGEGYTLAVLQILKEKPVEYAHLEQCNITIVPSTWTDAEAIAYMVADNVHARNSTPDNDILTRLLKGQDGSAKNLSAMGYTSDEANKLFLQVTQSHSADFLKDIINPPAPYQPKPFDPFPSEQKLPPTYEEGLQALGLTPDTLAAQAFRSHPPLPNGQDEHVPFTHSAVAPLSVSESPVTQDVQWFPVTYTLTYEHRQHLLDAIKKAKREFNLETSADALAKICSLYVGM